MRSLYVRRLSDLKNGESGIVLEVKVIPDRYTFLSKGTEVTVIDRTDKVLTVKVGVYETTIPVEIANFVMVEVKRPVYNCWPPIHWMPYPYRFPHAGIW